jgi:dihydrofolate reductase
MNKDQKAQARANALRDNLKKRKAFIKDSAEAALSRKSSKNAHVAVGGGTEEDALKPE